MPPMRNSQRREKIPTRQSEKVWVPTLASVRAANNNPRSFHNVTCPFMAIVALAIQRGYLTSTSQNSFCLRASTSDELRNVCMHRLIYVGRRASLPCACRPRLFHPTLATPRNRS